MPRFHRPFLDDLSSEKEIGAQVARQHDRKVKRALQSVHKAAAENLDEGIAQIDFRSFALAAACRSLEAHRAPEAAILYVRLGRMNARRILHGHEEPEIKRLLEGLASFLRAHGYDPGLMHFRTECGPRPWEPTGTCRDCAKTPTAAR